MKHFFTTLLLCAVAAVQAQQLPNVGFDNWKTTCGSTEAFGSGGLNSSKTGEMRQRPGVEPTDWNGSSVNQRAIATSKKELIFYDNEEGAVKMVNTYVGVGIPSLAPAFVNLGTPWRYVVLSSTNDCVGGVYGGVPFTYKPDAIKGRYKRTDATGENSHIIVYLWKGTYASNVGSKSSPNQQRDNVDRAIMGIDENTASTGTLVAKCDYTFTTTANGDWQEIVVPLEYVSDEAPEMMNTIISAADYWTFENMKEGTTLYADDVQFIYYSTLNTIEYNGVVHAVPVAGDTLDLSHISYDENLLNYTVNGRAAVATHSYDEKSALLTITVSNEGNDADGLSRHTYYVQFFPTIITEYTNDYTVSYDAYVDGGRAGEFKITAPRPTTIHLIEGADGMSLVFNNLILEMVPIGNIKLTDVTIDEDGCINAEQQVTITAGDDSAYAADSWIGPTMGEVPVVLNARIDGDRLLADIEIDRFEFGCQWVMKVVFAPTQIYSDGSELAIAPGLKNVALIRSFKAGWSTLCLPFDVDVEAFGYDENLEPLLCEVKEFAGVSEDAICFSSVETMVANTPYLVKFSADAGGPFYFGVTVEENTPVEVEYGDWRFVGTYTGIEAPYMEGLYGVTEILEDDTKYQAIRRGTDKASIDATRAYFENVSDTYMQKSVRIDFDGATTDVREIEDAQCLFPADVYCIDGRLARAAAENLDGLAKGIYVVKNKKFIVR